MRRITKIVDRRFFFIAFKKILSTTVGITTVLHVTMVGAVWPQMAAADDVQPVTTGVVAHKQVDTNGDGTFDVGNDADANLLGFRWGVAGGDATNNFGEWAEVTPGAQTVTENAVLGYHLVGWHEGNFDCNDTANLLSGPISIMAGIDATSEVTICNAHDLGTIQVNKWLWHDDSQTWVLDNWIATALGFQWGLDAEIPGRNLATSEHVTLGSHDVAENSVSGWEAVGYFFSGTDGNCDNRAGDGSLVYSLNIETSLDPYIVNFCNRPVPTGSVTLHKVVQGGTSVPSDWTFTIGDGTFYDGDTVTLPPGTYPITESGPVGYILTDVSGSCYDDGGTYLSVTLQGGDCTFTNTWNPATITVNKYFDDTGDGETDRTNPDGWTWDILAGQQNIPGGESATVEPGTHVLQEDPMPGYTTRWYCRSILTEIPFTNAQISEDDVAHTVTVAAGQRLVCSVVNTGHPNVTITKTDNHTTALPGETLTYQITLTNSGPGTATDLQVDDTLPGFLSTPTAISDSGLFASGHIIWNFLTVPGNSAKVLTFQATINPVMPFGTTVLHNLADLACSTPTILPDLEQVDIIPIRLCAFTAQATDDTSVSAAPTLGVTKTASVITVNPLQIYTYTVKWSVAGNSIATNVTMTDALPSDVTFISADQGGGYNSGNHTVTWNFGTKNPGDSGAGNVIVQVKSTTPNNQVMSNTASIKSAEGDPVFSAVVNVTNVVPPVPQVLGATTQPDLTITKSVNQKSARPGDVVKYTIVVTSTGTEPAQNVVVTDNLPRELSFVTAKGRNMTWKISQLDPGQSKTLTVDVRVNATTERGSYVNTASVQANEISARHAKATVAVTVPQVLGLATTGIGWKDYLIFMTGLTMLAFGAFGLYARRLVILRAKN